MKFSSRTMGTYLIQGLRYAQSRDNGLASVDYISAAKHGLEYLLKSDKRYYDYMVEKIIEEIDRDLRFQIGAYDKPREDEQEWRAFQEYLRGQSCLEEK